MGSTSANKKVASLNRHERHDQPAVSGVQEPELLNGQEQAQDHRAPRNEQVLSFLPKAHAA